MPNACVSLRFDFQKNLFQSYFDEKCCHCFMKGHVELFVLKDKEELSTFVTGGSELLDDYLEQMACDSAIHWRQCCNY